MNEDNKDIEIWKQRNEILHKKVERLMEELRVEHKLRQEAEGELSIMKGIETNRVKEAQAKCDHLQSKLDRAFKENSECYDRIAEILSVDDNHQKLNGKMQMRITELEQENLELYADNKKISRQIEDQLDRARKAGL